MRQPFITRGLGAKRPPPMKKAAALARLRQIASLGLPNGLFISSASSALCELTASDSAIFFWLNERGAVIDLHAERIPHLGAEGCQLTWPEARGLSMENHVIISTLAEEARGNPTLCEIFRMNGGYHLLHGRVAASGRAVGQISLLRQAPKRAYRKTEGSELAASLKYLARGLTTQGCSDPIELGRKSESALEEAIVVASVGGELVKGNNRGQKLLLMAAGCPLARGTRVEASPEVRELLLRCAEKTVLRRERRSVSTDTMWGRFTLHAYALGDGTSSGYLTIGVHVSRTVPLALRVVHAMNALPLSPQQRDIALLVAKGKSNHQIAETLSLSTNTVAYHIKQLFLKLKIHDRSALIGALSRAGDFELEKLPGVSPD